MKSNFFKDYYSRNIFSSVSFTELLFINVIFSIVLFLLGGFIVSFLSDIFNNLICSLTFIMKISLMGSVGLSFICIIARNVYWYYDNRCNSYAFFNTNDLEKWYALTPEKFVFCRNCDVVYYVHNENDVDRNIYRKDDFEECNLNISKMYPRNFFESIKYNYFVSRIFKSVKETENKKIQITKRAKIQKDIMAGNNEMIRIMNSIQKDINEVLFESNKIINEEINKIEKLNDLS